MKYPKIKAGQWIKPRRKGYQMACCDCGLVHELQFKLIKHGKDKKSYIFMRAFRNEMATGQIRHKMQKDGLIKLKYD